MSEKIASNILTAIDILTDKKLAEAKFDKTIVAEIVKYKGADTESYDATYKGAPIVVYGSAQTKYSIGDLVYVTVPEGDFTQDKIIQRKITQINDQIKKSVNLDNSSAYTKIGGFTNDASLSETTEYIFNTLNSSEQIIFNNPIEAQKGPYVKLMEESLAQSDLIAIEADFYSNIDQTTMSYNCNYGIELSLKFSYNIEEEDITKNKSFSEIETFIFDNSYMEGNPYQYRVQDNDLEFISKVTTFESNFIQSYKKEASLNKSLLNVELITLKVFAHDLIGEDIVKIKNIKIYGATKTSGATITTPNNKQTLTLIASPKDRFDSSIESGQLILTAQLSSKDKADTFEGAVYEWFVEDLNIVDTAQNGYSTLGGIGWRKLEEEITYPEENKTYQIKITPSILRGLPLVNIKCIAQYNGTTSSAQKTIYAEEQQPQYKITLERIDKTQTGILTLAKKDGSALEEGYNYKWSLIDAYDITFTTNTVGAIYTISDLSSIVNFNTYVCTVYNGDNIIEVVKRKVISTDATTAMVVSYSAEISNKTQIFSYNVGGQLMTTAKPLTVSLIGSNGQTIDPLNLNINWTIPSGGMISGTPSKGAEQTFVVNPSYSLSKINGNNSIMVVVEYNGQRYQATTNFSFVKSQAPSINGSEYRCIISSDIPGDCGEQAAIFGAGVTKKGKPFSQTFTVKVENIDHPETVVVPKSIEWSFLQDGAIDAVQELILNEDLLFQLTTSESNQATVTYYAPTAGGYEEFNNITNWPLSILKVTINVDDKTTVMGFLSLIISSEDLNLKPVGSYGSTYYPNSRFDLNSGIFQIIYESSGTSPSYIKDSPYYIRFPTGNNTYDHNKWQLLNKETSQITINKQDTTYDRNGHRHRATVSVKEILRNAYGTQLKAQVGAKDGNTVWETQVIIIIPVLCVLNRFDNVNIDNWDGTEIPVYSGEESKEFLRPKVGFGQLSTDSNFSGIYNGMWLGSLNSIKEGNTITDSGLFAYWNNDKKVGISAQTGQAFFKGNVVAQSFTAPDEGFYTGAIKIGQVGNSTDYSFQVDELGHLWATSVDEISFYPYKRSGEVEDSTPQFGTWLVETTYNQEGTLKMADGGLYSITGSDDGKGVGLAPLGIGETAFFAGDPAIEEDWLTAPWVVTHTGDMFIGGPSGYKFNTEGFAHNGANLLSATNINSNLKIGNTGISLQQLVDWYNSSGPGATDPEEPIE